MISSSSSSAVPVIPEESIFKNIMKRLSQLETNSSLTVSYIEEQSKLLSKSFEQLEMAHEAKFSHLVTIFNETMMSNLDLLNNFANQLKDQSLRILEEQKLRMTNLLTVIYCIWKDWKKKSVFKEELFMRHFSPS